MRPLPLILPILLVIAGCKVSTDDTSKPGSKEATTQQTQPTAAIDSLAAHDNVKSAQDIPDSEPRATMQAQVVLDRLGFTPGVVDGKEGLSTRNAISGFQEANELAVSGKLDAATIAALAQYQGIPATRVVTIPDDFAAGPFLKIPKDPQDQAKLPALGYQTLDEKLSERFHTTVATLKLLNPGGVPAGSPAAQPVGQGPAANMSTDPKVPPVSTFHAGQLIRVPNVGADAITAGSVTDKDWLATLIALGVSSEQPKVAEITVSKSKGTLKAYDEAGKLVAVYTATMGSSHDPLPLGDWGINGISRNPKFAYNPALFWDAKPGADKAMLAPGPNGPVGVVWIDLTKPHYGIHGTPNPETIGRAESHGCVRLTNWDAARLAQMVSTKTKVHFEA